MNATSCGPSRWSRCAAEGIADTHALAVARRVELVSTPSPTHGAGDRDALRTLVRNLVDNAVRYTPVGGRVQVRIRKTPTVRCSK